MELISTKVCKTSDLAVNNNLFGGTMLSWLDEAAASMASQICYTPDMITLRMDEVIFKAPVKENHHIKIYGKVKKIGNSSITLLVEARKLNLYTHEEKVVCTTKMVFVRVDKEGNAIPIAEHVKEKYKKAK